MAQYVWYVCVKHGRIGDDPSGSVVSEHGCLAIEVD